MATEKDLETALAKHPELIEEGLHLIGRQVNVHGRRMDVVFEDRAGCKVIAELKWGAVKDKDIGQLMAYEGWLVPDRPRVMLIGTRVPPNIQASLDYHGIEWREITSSELRKFLHQKGDDGLAKIFDDAAPPEKGLNSGDIAGLDPQVVVSAQSRAPGGPAALLAPVERKWLDKAREYFEDGKDTLYFVTNAWIGQAGELDVRNVYFKAKGDTAVTARADFVELTTDNPTDNRLAGGQPGRFYYGFRNLREIDPIQLSELRYYSTDKPLRNDVPGARIIKDLQT